VVDVLDDVSGDNQGEPNGVCVREQVDKIERKDEITKQGSAASVVMENGKWKGKMRAEDSIGASMILWVLAES
jgi:hypothetical protein